MFREVEVQPVGPGVGCDALVAVTNRGRLCLYRKKINLSTCLAGQAVGIKEVDDRVWLVSLMDFDFRSRLRTFLAAPSIGLS